MTLLSVACQDIIEHGPSTLNPTMLLILVHQEIVEECCVPAQLEFKNHGDPGRKK